MALSFDATTTSLPQCQEHIGLMGKIFVLGDDQIERLLETALVGRIACCDHVSGHPSRPFLVPLAYGYDGECVYAFSKLGRKIQIMRKQPMVTFEVDEAIAEDQWRSVIADGVYEELTADRGIERTIELLYPSGNVPQLPPDLIYYRLQLSNKTGRFEVPDEEVAALTMA